MRSRPGRSSKRIDGDEWLKVDADAFEDFRTSDECHASRSMGVNVGECIRRQKTSTATPSGSISACAKPSPAELFKKAIKLDPAAFPTLKDEKFKDKWHRQFVNQAVAQRVDNVLDETYTPTTAEEIELFEEQKKFVYVVLDSKVLTSKGKKIIRAHHGTKDGQKVYAEIFKHHTTSAAAQKKKKSNRSEFCQKGVHHFEHTGIRIKKKVLSM